MAAATLMPPRGPERPRRRQSPITFGRILVVLGIGVAIVIAWNLTHRDAVTERPNQVTTTTVILPPPPPPPPPPPEQVQQPPEPTVAPPIDQPVDTPPPPDQSSSDATPGDNALTAREGAGPSNYGLAGGDGSGTRIGGRPGGGGGDGFAAYANNVAVPCLRRAAQADRELSRGRYTVRLSVSVDPSGRISRIGEISGGDARRNARLREVLTGLQCQAPPANLPTMNIELNARSGG
ncbi:outer membrane transport energization protein TonB [Sphingomonas laterariae]|uniref:Outer membrane transport energization protein TonB n=1 Tax=Edaphosphingomonas laterariae TaxID=861865 RepID=A0A239GK68_9SPHN|nr:TonB-dependent receptor [Sphingomonas laterariae]SNS69381.1 outer membrane transport energization protein TonB [Sphingomonas laterariae]